METKTTDTTTTMTRDEFTKLMKSVASFGSLERAQSFADRDEKATMILMGDMVDDEPVYWVSRMAVAEKLIRAGYEAAPRF